MLLDRGSLGTPLLPAHDAPLNVTDPLQTFRNRIAHHEPIFIRHLEADYDSLLTVTGWICPRTREWIEHHSRVEALLGRPRDAADLLF